MKLAQLLNKRAMLNARIDRELNDGLAFVTHNEGEEPAVNPNDALADTLANLEDHLNLSLQVAQSNRETVVQYHNQDTTIADLIVHRQNLDRRVKILDKYLRSTRGSRVRWGRNELVQITALDVDSTKTIHEKLVGELREIDDLLQETNWSTDVD